MQHTVALPCHSSLWPRQQLVSLLKFTPTLPRSRSALSNLRTIMSVSPPPQAQPQLLSVAPMMDWTDVHYRQLARLISKRTFLYTEMVVDSTLIHNPNSDRFLWFPEEQHPIVCQLGGSEPDKLAAAAIIAAQYGYDEINLNCGCPSDRVAGAGCFGASLMLQADTVARCCAAMRAAVDANITVKCRLGVDDVDSYKELCSFIQTVSEGSGVTHFIMHARKCLLNGLTPLQNRTIPPLKYAWVFALKKDFPHLDFSLNGGVESCHVAAAALEHSVDGAKIQGVMIGRSAYHQPWACLADADVAVFRMDRNAAASRREVLDRYAVYGDAVLGRFGTKPDGSRTPNVRAVVKPLLGLFHGEAGGRKWRQQLDVGLLKKPASVSEVIQEAMKFVPDHVLDAPPQSRTRPSFSILDLPTPQSRAGDAAPTAKASPVAVPLDRSAGQESTPPGSSEHAADETTAVESGPSEAVSEAADRESTAAAGAHGDHIAEMVNAQHSVWVVASGRVAESSGHDEPVLRQSEDCSLSGKRLKTERILVAG